MLAGLLACGNAHAQPSPVFSWNGFYVGAHTAFVDGKHDIDVGVPFNLRPDGYAGGFQIGYWAHLSPSWVYGFEADISFADVSDTTAFPGLVTSLDRFGTARTRLGYARGPVLIYGTGGFAWGRTAADFAGFFNTGQSHIGWTAGAGVELALSSNWSVKLEYVHLDLGRHSEALVGPFAQDLTFQTYRLGLNYRLGAPSPASTTQAAPARSFNWSGAYIGIHGGYASGDQSMTYLGGTVPFEPTGGFGGFQSGYNWQLSSNVVLGIESDISLGSIKGSFIGDCCLVKIDQFGTVRLRAGYAFGNVLLYATAGLAWAMPDNSYLFSLITTDRPLVGWTAGLGVEYALSQKWSVKAEYLRFAFDDNKTEYVGLTPFIERAEYDVFRVGLNYRASLFGLLLNR